MLRSAGWRSCGGVGKADVDVEEEIGVIFDEKDG